MISTQVLQEFYVNVTRKILSPLPRAVGRQMVRTYAAWQTEAIGAPDIQLASEIEEQHRMSFWDALIIAAAVKGGAGTLLTEGMSTGSTIAGVRIENPFPNKAGAAGRRTAPLTLPGQHRENGGEERRTARKQ